MARKPEKFELHGVDVKMTLVRFEDGDPYELVCDRCGWTFGMIAGWGSADQAVMFHFENCPERGK